MAETRIALHEFGLISFDYKTWGKYQPFNPDTILRDFADICLKRNINICSVTSEYWELPRGSPHNRFDFLERQLPLLQKPYHGEKFSENMMVIEKDGKKVYLVNAQSVIVAQPTKNGKNRRLGHLVVGSNQVPNLKTLKDTIRYGQDNGLVQIAEDPYLTIDSYWGGSGLSEQELSEMAVSYDAIQGFKAQNTFPKILTKILPPLAKKSRELNEKAKETARKYKKPHVALTASHRLEDIGLAHIVTDEVANYAGEQEMINSLRRLIHQGKFRNVEEYAPAFGVLEWLMQFKKGCEKIEDVLDKKYEPMFE